MMLLLLLVLVRLLPLAVPELQIWYIGQAVGTQVIATGGLLFDCSHMEPLSGYRWLWSRTGLECWQVQQLMLLVAACWQTAMLKVSKWQ